MTTTIAVIASQDTKGPEVDHVVGLLHDRGCEAITVDISTSSDYVSTGTFTPAEVAAAAGVDWATARFGAKHDVLDTMTQGAPALVGHLFDEGCIDGVLAFGGLQNTTVGAAALAVLPVGFPKVLVSTVACGKRTFDMLVGTKDIVVIPAVAEIAGMNFISRVVLGNAVAAVVGMADTAGEVLHAPEDPVVATTLMGATNDGVMHAVDALHRQGQDVVCFHSTGVGGQVMEELIEDGTIRAAMDLTLHEVVYEYFGCGFGAGTTNRLGAAVTRGIPLVVAPGGIDFICQWKDELFPDVSSRRLLWHNSNLAHVKLRPEEARAVAAMIVERLNRATGPVEVLMPLKGLRSFVQPGEPLHDPQVEEAIFDEFRQGLRPDIPRFELDMCLMDPEFSEFAADRMLELLQRAGAPAPGETLVAELATVSGATTL